MKCRESKSIILDGKSKFMYLWTKHYFANAATWKLAFRRNKKAFMCAAILIIQFILLVKLNSDYMELYSLANSSFPDTFWHANYEKSRLSIRRVSNVPLRNESVIVLACGRDVEKAFPLFRKNLYSILKLFKDYRILLGESDSKDKTLVSFQSWKAKDGKVHVHTYGHLSLTYSKNRAHRIAYCRNDLLKAARKNNWINNFKFLFVMDIDVNANSVLTVDNFLTNFEYDTRDWAVMTASQTKLYYDIWAVKSETLNYDCWSILEGIKHQEIARKLYIYVHTKHIPREFGLIPVLSAFGGFGIYQTTFLNSCHYEAFDERTEQKCEHIAFHECIIRNGGKIFINPRFQNADGLTN